MKTAGQVVQYESLRDFLDLLADRGDLQSVTGADWDLEIGGITELAAGLPDRPALLFDDVVGYPSGHRVVTNLFGTPERAALAVGINPNGSPIDMLRTWKERRQNLARIPPVEVETARFLENELSGDEIDLDQLPVPKWHVHDGGRYIGTGATIVTRDPDTGWVNCAIYRAQVQGNRDLTIHWDHDGRHGAVMARKYWERGELAPVAVVIGADPSLFIAGFEYLPADYSELDFAGAIRGTPIEVYPGPLTGLPIPANAEIVLEGYIQPPDGDLFTEGPFGEFTGYYAAEAAPWPATRVERLYYRDNPILFGSPPIRPPQGDFGLPFQAATIWANLEDVGVSNITGVWNYATTLICVVGLKQEYAGHAKRAGLVAAAGLFMGRTIILVDDDIDPSNLDDVLWAIATRIEPEESVDIIRDGWSSVLDPRLHPARRARGDVGHSKMIINACRPFAWRDEFPTPSALNASELQDLREKWLDVLTGHGPKR